MHSNVLQIRGSVCFCSELSRGRDRKRERRKRGGNDSKVDIFYRAADIQFVRNIKSKPLPPLVGYHLNCVSHNLVYARYLFSALLVPFI